MISIITPTLWKAEELPYIAEQVLKHDKVGELIIIDNAKEDRPDYEFLSHKKVKILEQEQNIFVNPAWNLGVKKAKNAKICLMSDDIVFDTDVFDLVHDQITEKNGVIGPLQNSIKTFYVKSPLMELNPIKDVDNLWEGFGTLMFFHKKNYLPIPEELKIYWGDTWIWDYNAIQCRQNYALNKFCLFTKMRTSSGLFKETTDEEEKKYLSLFNEMYQNNFKSGNCLSNIIAQKVYDLIKEYE